uniref:Sulfotransfer_1 domain-containing protein n=1 Tax=Onchocerca volvulus TaxID=6282 RepID=A0A8R1XUY0_ONCVO
MIERMGAKFADNLDSPRLLKTHFTCNSNFTFLDGRIFIRRDGSEDWKNYFTRDHSDRLDAIYHKYLTGTIAEHWWEEEITWDKTEEDIGIESDLSFTSVAEECCSSSSKARFLGIFSSIFHRIN